MLIVEFMQLPGLLWTTEKIPDELCESAIELINKKLMGRHARTTKELVVHAPYSDCR